MNRLKVVAAVIVLISSAGCMVGPRYHQPAAPVQPQFKEGASSNDENTNAIAYSNWWLVFNDPELEQLEIQADRANQDVKAAIARVDQAQAYLKVSRSYLFPTVAAGGSGSRNREAMNRPNNGNTGGKAATYNDFQVSMLLGYEIDFWGRLRHAMEAANAMEQSGEANVRFVRLVVQTGLAIDYYGLRELDAEREVLISTLQALQQAVDLTQRRMQGGLASEYDVAIAQTLFDQTDAQAKQIEIQRSQLEHVIAVLTGQPASSFSLARNPLRGTPPSIPAGLPSQLLERRPDISQVERTLAASNAQIGVARAAQFPQFSLSAAAGFESVNPASLLSWQNSLASIGSGVLAPVFTGGRLKAQVEQARATYRESLANYEQSVLTAYQQVEDQLAALRILAGEADSEAKAVDDARRTEEVAMNRYKTGLVSYLDVVNAQAMLLNNQRTQTQISGQQLVASVALVKALGGGWLGVPSPVKTTGN
ncbi:MAG TPA: efflux transporter outer membrane subunit [Edaphobacter sp.]|nr:efflux transporter outer membrane subunit [Edaphobacter sp.]